jgi:uncharacterized protein (TIGR02270 family)
MSIIATVVSQHADEASFLWTLRNRAVGAPHYSLADLAKLDGRVEAHLDGLRIAGEEGWALCEGQLAANEEGEVFAAGVLAGESPNPALMTRVLSVVEAEPKLAGGLISGLGWPAFEQVQSHIQSLLQHAEPVRQLVGIAAMTIHRQHPGRFLLPALQSHEPGLKARALAAAGEFADRSLERQITGSLRHEDAVVRFSAGWSGALLGISASLPVLREVAESQPCHAGDAATLAARRMDPAAAASWQKSLARDPKHLRLGILVAGAIGDPALVPWLISLMEQLPLARLAGEAFTMITGVGIDYRDLERKPPEDYNAGPTEDPQDENVEMDPDENLPWPDPVLVQKWWDKNRNQFQNGTRYLCGQPISVGWCKTVLRDGFQRHRAAAALELTMRQPGTSLFNVEAPGFRQIQLLGKPQGPIR